MTLLGRITDPVWTPWASGPVRAPEGPVVVSVTEFVPHTLRHVHAFVLDGLRLREGWYAMEGAVGLYLYGQPARRRGGSVSVWTESAALRRFIRLPRHVEIMRTYRPLGTVRATTFEAAFDRNEVKRRALDWLRGERPPGPPGRADPLGQAPGSAARWVRSGGGRTCARELSGRGPAPRARPARAGPR